MNDETKDEATHDTRDVRVNPSASIAACIPHDARREIQIISNAIRPRVEMPIATPSA
jgi:hypothetical protein